MVIHVNLIVGLQESERPSVKASDGVGQDYDYLNQQIFYVLCFLEESRYHPLVSVFDTIYFFLIDHEFEEADMTQEYDEDYINNFLLSVSVHREMVFMTLTAKSLV